MNVLVVGGDATARAEVAEAFHRESPLRTGPLVMVDAVRDAAPLFAAFRAWTTGSSAPIPVSIAAAERGTLFIDSIQRLNAESQRRLRELIDRGIGVADAGPGRLVAGNAEDLAEAVARDAFSAALYDALDKVRIELPALVRGAA